MQKYKISILGAGNVGTHLALALYETDYTVLQIFSREKKNAQDLAKKVNASAISSIANLSNEVDIIFVCVSDSAIADVVNKIDFQSTLIAHTAGSVSIDILNEFNNFGVFYPLQSFSKQSKLDIKTVPFCIEANTQENKNILLSVAKSLSESVYELSSEQRLQCHLAAVFDNNFSNHMFAIAEQLLSKNQISFDILKPLILETANKVQNTKPILAQTGPAFRNDKNTIKQHLDALQSPQLEKIYSFVSKNILDLKIGNLPFKNSNNKDE